MLQYLKDETGVLKTDEKSGHPLVFDDAQSNGAESPFPLDGIHLYGKIPALQEEAKAHRLKAKDFETKLMTFDGIDPAKAREAITALENLDRGDLTKAEDVEKIKQEITTAYEAKLEDVAKGYKGKLTEASNELLQKDQTIYDLAISDRFARSKYFSGGEKSLSHMTSSMAKAYLGSFFKVEDNKVVGYWNGNRIMDRAKPTDLADFEEALDIIIQNHPERDAILRSAHGGSGALGSEGDAGKASISRTVFDSMDAVAKHAFVTSGGIVKD